MVALPTEEEKKLLEKVRPYLCGPMHDQYKDGTPQEIKDMHKKLIELAAEDY